MLLQGHFQQRHRFLELALVDVHAREVRVADVALGPQAHDLAEGTLRFREASEAREELAERVVVLPVLRPQGDGPSEEGFGLGGAPSVRIGFRDPAHHHVVRGGQILGLPKSHRRFRRQAAAQLDHALGEAGFGKLRSQAHGPLRRLLGLGHPLRDAILFVVLEQRQGQSGMGLGERGVVPDRRAKGFFRSRVVPLDVPALEVGPPAEVGLHGGAPRRTCRARRGSDPHLGGDPLRHG